MSGLRELCITNLWELRMRRLIFGISLSVVAVTGVGCASSRTPNVVIAPSYSYVQADIANGVSDTQQVVATAAPARLSSATHKLPPLPAAPGFDTYVMAPTNIPID